MKTNFPGYYAPSDDDLNAIWDDCFVTFDACVLLNLYRYSERTANEYLQAIADTGDRVWICHQSGLEFHRNRITVIESQERSCENLISKMNTCDNDLGNKRSHPYIGSELHKRFRQIVEEIKADVGRQKTKVSQQRTDDAIRDRLSKIFDGKIGAPYDETTLEQIYELGERRFESHIPPGFKDSASKAEPARKYGDLVLWFQLLETAEGLRRSAVFVTDDLKPDWWDTELKKPPCPRAELVMEFQQRTGKQFFMYKPDDFLREAKNRLKTKVNDEAIEEVKEVGIFERANRSLTSLLEWQAGEKEISPEAAKVLLAEQERLLTGKVADKIAQLGRMAGIFERLLPESIVDDERKGG